MGDHPGNVERNGGRLGTLLGSMGDVRCHQGGLVSLGLSSQVRFTQKWGCGVSQGPLVLLSHGQGEQQGRSMQPLGKTSGMADSGPAWTLSPGFVFLGERDVRGLVLWVSVRKSRPAASPPWVSLTGANSGARLDFGEVPELDGTRAVPAASWGEPSRDKVGLHDLRGLSPPFHDSAPVSRRFTDQTRGDEP